MFHVATEETCGFHRDYTLNSEMGRELLMLHTDTLKRERTHLNLHTSLGRQARVTLFSALQTRPNLGPSNDVDNSCFCIWCGDSSGSQVQTPQKPLLHNGCLAWISAVLSFLVVCHGWMMLLLHNFQSTHSIVFAAGVCSHGASREPPS